MKKKANRKLKDERHNQFYRIDIEFPFGSTEPKFKYICLFETIGEEEMKKRIAKLKSAGMGGRVALLDGTPEGKIQETWGSVERVAAAEKEEKQALTR